MNSEIRLPPEHCGAQGNICLLRRALQMKYKRMILKRVPASSLKEHPVVLYSYSC